MTRIVFGFIVALLVGASNSSAQIIYQPVQYQYGTTAKYYYGGDDPRVFARADLYESQNLHRRLNTQPLRVYTDCIPSMNAAVFGYTPVDAQNEANSRVPLYFRKSDLLPSSRQQSVENIVIPAQARPMNEIVIKPFVRRTLPATSPRPLIIIPKVLFDQPIRPSKQLVISAVAKADGLSDPVGPIR